MRATTHHLALLRISRLLPVLLGVLGLAACAPTWGSRVPVTRDQSGPLQVQRPATVTVYAGDTVYGIARRYSLSVRDLIEANGLQPPYQLSPGMILRIPGGGSDYVVQRGDTLSVLARRLKVDFNSLAAINNKKPPYVLYVGERLRLPSAARDAAAAVADARPAGGESGPIVAVSPNAAPRPPSPPLDGAEVPSPPPRAGTAFLWPVRGEIIAEFGPLPNRGQHNDGINIAAPKGTPVKAADNGSVAYVGNELKGFGNLLLVKHADGWMTAYAHAETLLVKRGEMVRRGQIIATVGMSGNATQPQLHFEIRRGTEAVNPSEYLRDSLALAASTGEVSANPY
ncbi:M23 family metallopeptidase [Magnetospirillum sp. SS-4]|uniref:M23 family metallopeptidase n=1 Tax=Magnetospirillum sp. SS-4 TaxID=2681465 RepID=UPI001573DD3F|nr:M23 family metallopeptidase [Magnetospirillum sp. SS-4]